MNTMDSNSAQTDPSQAQSDDTTAPTVAPPQPPVGFTSSGGKEMETGVGLGNFEIPELTEIGRDVELPKEVESAGVKVIPSPQKTVLLQKGATVQYNAPAQQGSTAQKTKVVPLSDDQIAAGLKQSVKSSWRWLAEWCVRKLKQLQRAVKN